MSAIVVTPPEPIVTLAQAKRHLIVEHDDDDVYIGDLVAVATAWIDGPDGWLGRALGEQVLEASYACFRDAFRLPYGPVLSIEEVRCRDAGGVERVLDPGEYELRGWLLGAAFGRRFPGARHDSVRVRYRAGYATGKVPAPIRHAILVMVGDLYANRESGAAGASFAEAKMPTTVLNLLSPYRVWSV